jgi:hypothetical protein
MSSTAPRPHVLVATPCYGGLVTQAYTQSMIALMRFAAGDGFDVSLSMLGCDSLITRSRNTLVGCFLEKPEATHLMFIDADISFPPEQVGRMLRFGVDVVGGMYPLKALHWDQAALVRAAGRQEPIASAPLMYVGQLCEGEELACRDGFATGVYAGCGFLMIRRAAIERLIAAYPETAYRQWLAYPPRPDAPVQHALFECMIDAESGTYLSEDFAFCRRWRAIGGQIWLDTESRLTHTGSYDFSGSPAARCAPLMLASAA